LGTETDAIFAHLLNECKDLVVQYTREVRSSAQVDVPRLSCKFTDAAILDDVASPRRLFLVKNSYAGVPFYDWACSPTLVKVRAAIEAAVGTTFDYALVHVYRDGSDSIGWHYDDEAMTTPIASLSLGSRRTFLLQPRNVQRKEALANEVAIALPSGTLVEMKVGCQQRFLHMVPRDASVTEPRINITLRKYEGC
jgi:hypothetical protein